MCLSCRDDSKVGFSGCLIISCHQQEMNTLQGMCLLLYILSQCLLRQEKGEQPGYQLELTVISYKYE